MSGAETAIAPLKERLDALNETHGGGMSFAPVLTSVLTAPRALVRKGRERDLLASRGR